MGYCLNLYNTYGMFLQVTELSNYHWLLIAVSPKTAISRRWWRRRRRDSTVSRRCTCECRCRRLRCRSRASASSMTVASPSSFHSPASSSSCRRRLRQSFKAAPRWRQFQTWSSRSAVLGEICMSRSHSCRNSARSRGSDGRTTTWTYQCCRFASLHPIVRYLACPAYRHRPHFLPAAL